MWPNLESCNRNREKKCCCAIIRVTKEASVKGCCLRCRESSPVHPYSFPCFFMFTFKWVEQCVSKIAISHQSIMWLDVVYEECRLATFGLRQVFFTNPTSNPLEALEPSTRAEEDVDWPSSWDTISAWVFHPTVMADSPILTSQKAVISSMNGRMHSGTLLWSANSGE